jgi:putative component of membrane protein insertase Oxa1/YidC/SpoIIIJ protein YidD
LIAFFIVAVAGAQPLEPRHGSDDFVPWEFGEDHGVETSGDLAARPVLERAVELYRDHSGGRTTNRCIFHVSCSHFLEQAVSERGVLLGIVMFIDRNMYRENLQAYGMYETLYRPDGVLEVDDGFYLE